MAEQTIESQIAKEISESDASLLAELDSASAVSATASEIDAITGEVIAVSNAVTISGSNRNPKYPDTYNKVQIQQMFNCESFPMIPMPKKDSRTNEWAFICGPSFSARITHELRDKILAGEALTTDNFQFVCVEGQTPGKYFWECRYFNPMARVATLSAETQALVSKYTF